MKTTTKELTTNIVLVSATVLFLATILYGLFYKPEFDPIQQHEQSFNMNSANLEIISKCNKYKTIDCTPSHISSLKDNIEYSYNLNSSLRLISSVERAQ